MYTQEELLEKVKKVCQTFPWYKELISSKEVRSLTDLPLMTASLLEKHYYAQPLDDPSLAVYKTSGTSSKIRKKIYYSQTDDQRYLDMKVKVFSQFIQGSQIKRALSDMGTGHAASTATAIFDQLKIENESISFQAPIEEHIDKLTQFKPELFYTMPSILDHIILSSKDPLSYGIKKIILVGEIASREWMNKAAAVFNIQPADILDTYGSIEIGTLAYYSHPHQRYLLVDGLVGEGITPKELDFQTEPLGEKESILVLTSWIREKFPALRFITYDVVRDLRPIKVDGIERQSFESIVKRVGPELKHGEKISIYDIEEVVYRYLDKASIRVKVETNKLKVYIKSHELNKAKIELLQQKLQQQIPEIGIMIKNKMLDQIMVIHVKQGEAFPHGAVKNKKLYY